MTTARTLAELREAQQPPAGEANRVSRYHWTVDGETHRPGSHPEYQPESASGTVTADSAGEALSLMVTGPGAPLDDTIPWDLIDQYRPIVVKIWPEDTPDWAVP